MSDLNSLHNLTVWCDIPVADLDRASAFYAATLDIGVDKVEAGEFQVLPSSTTPRATAAASSPTRPVSAAPRGVLMYMNVDGRIRDAIAQTEKMGGKVIEAVHADR